jgi:hypothetical protein
MSTHDEPTHRRTHEADPDAVSVRDDADVETDAEGLFRIRMPVTSTGEARDGEAFTRDRVEGFRDQIAESRVPLFLDHGRGGPGETRYSQLRKVGYWDAPSIEERNGTTELDADAVLVDPDTLADDVGEIRAALSWLRAQAEAGLPIASSVGWSEATGERDLPGDADLLEISIVGIPSDPRTTTTAGSEPALARAVSAASEGFDVATFVRELNASERNVVEVGGEEIDLTPPEAVQNAATLALAKDDELDTGCGTGAGDTSARQIAGDDVTADRIDDIAAYLTSHEEDVTAEGPPSDWDNEEWADCGNIQYAKWGGTGTGTGIEWAQSKANDVADAAGDERPYPERSMTDRNLDDPEFSEGDAVEWSSNDTTVRGRVAEVGDEFTPAEGVTITGDEGEAVYLIHELDDSLEPPQYRRENVAKPESSLDESQADLPPLDGNFADEDTNMSESDSEPDAESGTDSDASNARGMEEKIDEVREMCARMDERMGELHEEMMGGDENGMDGDDEEEEDDEDEGENAADAADSDERTVTLDGEERAVDEALEQLREAASEAEHAEPQTRDHAPESDADDGERDADAETDDNEPSGFGIAAKLDD